MTYANDNSKEVQPTRRQYSEEDIARLMRNCEAALRRYKFKVVSCND